MFPDDCPFCFPDFKFIHPVMNVIPDDISEQFLVLYDQFPVSKGHSLIITRKHFRDITVLPDRYFTSLKSVISMVQTKLTEEFSPDGFNIGINQGRYAGQTISHFHMHIIPRYKGDVENPRGGIRNVIPGKGDY
jgi:diadenosine tetraphosphate (Ap4A) HIT family hydrolase